MRKLSYDYKLPGRSIAEVHSRFEEALGVHQRARRIKFNGRKLTAEAFVNAVMMHFLELDPAEQERILARHVAAFESLLADDAPAPEAGHIEATNVIHRGRKPKGGAERAG